MTSGPSCPSASRPTTRKLRSRELIKSLLAVDYPRDRLQVLITSDGSEDATEAIIGEYADQGIELLSMPERGGKTKAENAASELLRGEIVVNTDASTRILPDALKPLVAALRDPSVGCASGRDVSVGAEQDDANRGESGYVGYEMAVRDLETRVSLASSALQGCFYAIRDTLHQGAASRVRSAGTSPAALHAQ